MAELRHRQARPSTGGLKIETTASTDPANENNFNRNIVNLPQQNEADTDGTRRQLSGASPFGRRSKLYGDQRVKPLWQRILTCISDTILLFLDPITNSVDYRYGCDPEVHICWGDLLQIPEGMVWYGLVELWNYYVQPIFGRSESPLEMIQFSRMEIFFIVPLSYFFLYFTVGSFIYFGYEKKYIGEVEKIHPDIQVTGHQFWKAISLSCKSILSICFISNISWYMLQGQTNIYWDFYSKPWWYSIPSTVVAYLVLDWVLYWQHRFFHWPWFYSRVHKMHHAWKYPFSFTQSALGTSEILMLAFAEMSILNLFPIWGPIFIVYVTAHYLCNTITHSGHHFKHHILRWQVEPEFHDDHHVYFHVNYAPCLDWWDKFYGTYYDKTLGEEVLTKAWQRVYHKRKVVKKTSSSEQTPMYAQEPVSKASPDLPLCPISPSSSQSTKSPGSPYSLLSQPFEMCESFD